MEEAEGSPPPALLQPYLLQKHYLCKLPVCAACCQHRCMLAFVKLSYAMGEEMLYATWHVHIEGKIGHSTLKVVR